MEADVLQTLDPSKASEGVSGQAIIDTMNGLYKYYGHDLQPAMATKIVKPTNNGLTYTFTLRNAKWSDGTPVTAQDFVFAWQRTVDPATKSTQANMYSGIKNADDIRAGKKPATDLGIKAINDKTLEVTLEHPIPYFNSLLNNVAFSRNLLRRLRHGAPSTVPSRNILCRTVLLNPKAGPALAINGQKLKIPTIGTKRMFIWRKLTFR